MSAPPAHVHASVRPTVQRRRSRFQPLPFLALLNNLVGLGAIQKGTSRKDLPVVEHAVAWPPVLDRRSAVNPKDSLTVRLALTTNMGCRGFGPPRIFVLS